MPRSNRVGTIKVPLSLDPTTNRVLERLASASILGKNKAEVALTILRTWLWDNEEKLRSQGVRLLAKGGR